MGRIKSGGHVALWDAMAVAVAVAASTNEPSPLLTPAPPCRACVCVQLRYLERYSQKAAATGRSTVVRVDASGIPQAVQDAKANRYQCGPFALELGGGAGAGASAAAAGGPGQPGGIMTHIGPGAGAGGMRVRKRGGGGMVNACFGGEE